MTICIDCRHINSSGIGSYLKGCLPWFLQAGNNYLLILNSAQLRSFSSNTNVTIIACDIKPFSIKELFFFPRKIARHINKADFYFSPFFNVPGGITIPVFTTIHDIIFPDMPELTSKAGLAARMWFYRRAYRKSQKIFTVSQFSKSRIEHYLGTGKPVIVTYESALPMFLEYRAKGQKSQKTQTIVFVGNIKKHKGLDYLLSAFLLAKKEGLPHTLIIIGSKERFRTADNAIQQNINSDAVSFTGFISDEQLMEYLSAADLLVQPSLYEGFGLPPLEAMVLGTQALIADIPVFREIYAEYPVTFFRAGDTHDLKDKMMGLLFGQEPSSPVLPSALLFKYTFEKTAETILRELK